MHSILLVCARSSVITIVIASDSEQMIYQLAMAASYVFGGWGLVVANATSSIDEWFCSFARAFKCVFDVGLDDFGDDVDHGDAGFAITA